MSKNLESAINKVGYEIAEIIDENNINKFLGVLANDGVYAMWVFSNDKLKLNSVSFWQKILCNEQINLIFSNEKIKLDKLVQFTKDEIKEMNTKKNNKEKGSVFKNWQERISNDLFHKLSEDLSSLLFFRELLEKALIYARYHAKAMRE